MSWPRHKDDVFIIWDGEWEELDTFMTGLNSNNFVALYSDLSRIFFIDIQIPLQGDNTLASALTFLHMINAHLVSLVIRISYSNFLCLRHNCLDKSYFPEYIDLLIKGLLGYSKNILIKDYNRLKKKCNFFLSDNVKIMNRYTHQHKQNSRYFE